MSALEADITNPHFEETGVTEYLQQLLLDAGFDLTGMNPEEVQNIAKSFQWGMDEFRNPARRILRGDIEPPEF
ncbi:hypothetical protein JW752_02505 [Candidatus Peregrinibacteria bacterium]|nr:hypothetical protein [Candidatus Peregrinibacteria bacterium]